MNDDPVAAIRGWLLEPASDTGIYFADESDGWEYRSYADIAENTWSVADLLRAHGMTDGAGVCVVMPTGFACAAAFYAVWACGGVFTPVAPPTFGDIDQYVAHVAAILRQAQPRVVLTSVELVSLVQQAGVAAGRSDEPVIVPTDLSTQGAGASTLSREFGTPDPCALVQFTSGSTGTPRGVRISWANLAANIDMITRLIAWRPADAMVSWLPLYHDMGLIGAFLTTVTNQGELSLLRPDQFVRDPARWLRAMTRAQHCPSPSFALGYVAHRVAPDDIAELDFSQWRTLAIGSEPVEAADLQAFADLTSKQGFSTNAYTLAYGLAEATLMVTASERAHPITAIRVDTGSLRPGDPVRVTERARIDDMHRVTGAGWITGLGYSTPESTVRIVDPDGRELPEGSLGEVSVTGDSVAMGYVVTPDSDSGTRIVDQTRSDHREGIRWGAQTGSKVLYTGDAGFISQGEVFVLGRMGSSLKVRGRSVFMEDIESRVARETGITKGKLAAVAVTTPGARGVALFAEAAPGAWLTEARTLIRGELGPAQSVTLITGPRGFIRRTSSGKPRRNHLWQLYTEGQLAGAQVQDPEHAAADSDSRDEPADWVRQLYAQAAEQVELPADAAVLFEGSLAEGFGNAGSDVDYLVVAPGADELPTMPTVLFIDGRRVEIRTRSADQLRTQLTRVAQARSPESRSAKPLAAPASAAPPEGEGSTASIGGSSVLPDRRSDHREGIHPDAQTGTEDLSEDLLNRCQRFLHAQIVSVPDVGPDVAGLRELLPAPTFADILSRWWMTRARHALRYALGLHLLGQDTEAVAWGTDGLAQAMKGWLAQREETYLETKWLPQQLSRVGDDPSIDRYHQVLATAPDSVGEQTQSWWSDLIELADQLGVTGLADAADQVVFARVPDVTTWPLGDRLHVLRGRQVFALSQRAGSVWRSVVFRHRVSAVLVRAATDIRDELAEFLRLGLIGLAWRTSGPITPALAMCEPVAGYTPIPTGTIPTMGVTGVAASESIVTLSPLSARQFTECGLQLIWSNIVLENAREDLAGAVRDQQAQVADIAAHRMLAMTVRVLLSAYGIHPLPADVAPLDTLRRMLPTSAPQRTEILAAVDAAHRVRFSELLTTGTDPAVGFAALDACVAVVRAVAGGADFPASFDSRKQWQRTLALGYDWLRLAGFLDTDLPLDEARDLLASGGQQPHNAKDTTV